MDDLLELLLAIEKRPKLFLGCEELKALRNFVDGYCMAKRERESGYGTWLYDDLRLWLAGRYQDSRSLSWDSLIIEHEGNALGVFYRLLHEYLELHPMEEK